MRNDKKRIPAVLLLSVFALLLLLEVVVSPVFCYKDNGAVDFELTVMDMLCGCTGDHEHGDSHEPEAELRCEVACGFNPCVDLPQDSSWLQRNTHRLTIHFDCFKQVPGILQGHMKPIRPFHGRGPLILLSKFLPHAPPASDGVILLC